MKKSTVVLGTILTVAVGSMTAYATTTAYNVRFEIGVTQLSAPVNKRANCAYATICQTSETRWEEISTSYQICDTDSQTDLLSAEVEITNADHNTKIVAYKDLGMKYYGDVALKITPRGWLGPYNAVGYWDPNAN